MISNVLPQALYLIPGNTALHAQKKWGLSAMVSLRPALSFSSRVSLNSSQFSFVVRAEANEDGGETENEENEEEVEENEAEVEEEAVESEEKQPRKPIIKLGDIMGV